MTKQDLVTIGITCFNARDTVGRAIASALAQNWDNLEVLIADDASSDGSAEFIAELVAGEPRARLIRRDENGGAAAARNTIIGEAKGSFIAFFDDDDESHPDRVAQQVAAVKQFESEHDDTLVACYASGGRLYANGYVKPLPAVGSLGEPPRGAEMADYLLFYRRNPKRHYGSGTPTCALLARRATFETLNGFDANLRRVEDVDFAVRLALAGGWFIGTREQLFTQHATAGTDKAPEANRAAEVAVAEKHRDYLQSIRRYHYARRWPNLRFYHFKRQYGRFALEFLAICLRNPITAVRHLLSTGPRRLKHERRMNLRSPM